MAGHVTRQQRLEDVRVADLARAAQGPLRFESIHGGLHGGVRGTRLGKPFLDLAHRGVPARPQDLEDLQFEPGQCGQLQILLSSRYSHASEQHRHGSVGLDEEETHPVSRLRSIVIVGEPQEDARA